MFERRVNMRILTGGKYKKISTVWEVIEVDKPSSHRKAGSHPGEISDFGPVLEAPKHFSVAQKIMCHRFNLDRTRNSVVFGNR
ncbi:hypothetical protein CEXT_431441 [Caerostris extrusa]|uniref:Uncharacterized protein n=1 Tax=Caerostris extrusa TaxID=172846 RepID=A0AAV4TME4_CAEEX|nr:hypothetical protein CEXT_431441 [Caerostris extrusa]